MLPAVIHLDKIPLQEHTLKVALLLQLPSCMLPALIQNVYQWFGPTLHDTSCYIFFPNQLVQAIYKYLESFWETNCLKIGCLPTPRLRASKKASDKHIIWVQSVCMVCGFIFGKTQGWIWHGRSVNRLVLTLCEWIRFQGFSNPRFYRCFMCSVS